MGSAPKYWGYLVEADKNPSVIFEQLLVSIANYIVRLRFVLDATCFDSYAQEAKLTSTVESTDSSMGCQLSDPNQAGRLLSTCWRGL